MNNPTHEEVVKAANEIAYGSAVQETPNAGICAEYILKNQKRTQTRTCGMLRSVPIDWEEPVAEIEIPEDVLFVIRLARETYGDLAESMDSFLKSLKEKPAKEGDIE